MEAFAQRAPAEVQVDVEPDGGGSVMANSLGAEDLDGGHTTARFDRDLAREQMRVYTAWCFGALFVLGAIAQCATWIAHLAR